MEQQLKKEMKKERKKAERALRKAQRQEAQLTTELFQRGYRKCLNLPSAMGSAKLAVSSGREAPGGVPPRGQ